MKKTEIMPVFNKYKNIFEDFNNSLDIKSLNKSRLVNKMLQNLMLSSENSLTDIKLNKNSSDGLQ